MYYKYLFLRSKIYKPVIKIDEITGSYLSIREAFDIKLMLEKILIGIYIDPKSLKEFETVKYYSFKREF